MPLGKGRIPPLLLMLLIMILLLGATSIEKPIMSKIMIRSRRGNLIDTTVGNPMDCSRELCPANIMTSAMRRQL